MRRTGKRLKAALPALVAAFWAAAMWSPLAVAQPSTNSLPTAIISSGRASVESSPPANQLGARDQASAWTADRNPLGGQLRPNASQGYPPLPTGDGGVVTASAQSGGVPAGVQPVGAQSMGAVHSAPGDDGAEAKHIPLAPPTERFKGEAPAAASSTLQTIVSVGSSLLLVVGLFLGVAWCYRKTLSSSVGGALPKQVVQIMGRTSISTRQQMVLVRFGSKLLLVSVIQGEARTLSEISDPLEVDRMIGLCESGQPGSISNSFKSVLLQEGNR